MAAVGIYLCVGKIVASIAQAQDLRSIGKAATSVLPPLPPLYFSFQNESASYAGRSVHVRALPPLSGPMILPAPVADLP